MSNFKKESHKINALLKKHADEDELLENLRALIFRREKIIESVNHLKQDCDKLIEILMCSTTEDVELIIEEVYPVQNDEEEKFKLTTEEKKLLVNRTGLIENFNMQNIFGIGIRTSLDNSILTQFTPLPNDEGNSEVCLVDFKRKPNSKLMVNHTIIPDIEEIKTVENAYINKDLQDIPSYLYVIQQCLLAFWNKGMIMESLKKENRVNESKIYCNKKRTLISFIFKCKDKCYAEFKLLYDLTTFYPYKVQYKIISNRQLPEYAETSNLDELKELLLNNSVEKAFLTYISNEESLSNNGSFTTGSLDRLEIF
ncbi:UNVERIFIED_CONTAM: hypothetical protein RMT77_003076 [Armadillidium vulgare]